LNLGKKCGFLLSKKNAEQSCVRHQWTNCCCYMDLAQKAFRNVLIRLNQVMYHLMLTVQIRVFYQTAKIIALYEIVNRRREWE